MLICIACLLAVVMVFLMHQNPNKGVQCIMFSKNLKTLRKQKGFSQEELASRLHVVRQTISKWEKNLSVPDADTLIRLAEILEVSVSELLGSKIENENGNGNVTNDVAEQLSRINEQLAMKNRRSRRIWKAIAIILVVFFLISVFIIMTSIAAFITISQL
jgi:putative transcriptional regulator